MPILDTLAVEWIIPGSFTGEEQRELTRTVGRALVGLLIWGSYFNSPQRVKETFVNRYVK